MLAANMLAGGSQPLRTTWAAQGSGTEESGQGGMGVRKEEFVSKRF